MHRNIFSCTAGVALLAIGLAACSSDAVVSPDLTLPDSEVNQSMASDVGDAMATSVDLMAADEDSYASAERSSAPGVNAAIAGDVTVQCSGPDNDGWFTCDKTTWRGLDLLRQKRFWEGTSFGLGFDARTDSVNHRRTLSGSFTPAWNTSRTVWVNRADTATMHVRRAVTPVQHAWDGTGQRHDSTMYIRTSRTRVFHYTAYDTVTAVTFDMPRSQYVWPLSGSIVHNVTALVTVQSGTRSYSRTVTRRAEVIFNGTPNVTLDIGDLTCDLDLETHAVTNCH